MPGLNLELTSHASKKMSYYGLSLYRVKRVIDHPERIEEGIAEDTIALMQKAGSEKHPYEIWTMIQDKKSKAGRIRKIISAWKYPGETKPGKTLPAMIMREIEEAL